MFEDVCDQLEVTDEPAEVKIFTEEVLEAAANEVDQDPLNIISEKLADKGFIKKDDEQDQIFEIPESSQLAQTLLE